MADASRKTEELITQWIKANQHVSSLKSQLNSAECSAKNAETALAKHLTPPDASDQETFHIWVRDPDTDSDRLLEITVESLMNHNFKVRYRNRAKLSPGSRSQPSA